MNRQHVRPYIYVFLLLLLGNVAYAEHVYTPEEVTYESGRYIVKKIGKPVTGIIKDYYPNGQLKCFVEFKDGIQHGKEIVWYSNGNKQREVKFVNGKHQGCWVFWHENGQIAEIHGKDMIVGFYENGQKRRILIYEKGNLMFSKEWNRDGYEKVYDK